MKKIIALLFLCISCTNSQLQVFPIENLILYDGEKKYQYFEVSNYENKSNDKLLNELSQYCSQNIKLDSVLKYKKYTYFFYEKHFYINYNCDVKTEYLNADSASLYEMDGYLISQFYFEKTNNKKVIRTKILYKKHLIKLEILDTITLEK